MPPGPMMKCSEVANRIAISTSMPSTSEFGDDRELGEIDDEPTEIDHAEPDAQGLHLGDDDGGEESPADRTHASDHDDHERVADHDQVESQIGWLARDLQRAAEAGQERA